MERQKVKWLVEESAVHRRGPANPRAGREEEEDEPEAPVAVLSLDAEPLVYLITADLIQMVRNAAEGYVVARAMVDACGRFPVEPEHTADEVRYVADSVSRLIRIQGDYGRVSEKDIPRLANAGKALLNTIQFMCPHRADVCFIVETIAYLFERGLDRSSNEYAHYEKCIRGVTEELASFFEECIKSRERLQASIWWGHGLRKGDRGNPMYG